MRPSLAGLHIPSMPRHVRYVLAADADVAQLMVAQFLQQPPIGMRRPGPPRRAQQGPRNGQKNIAGSAEGRLAMRMNLQAVGPM